MFIFPGNPALRIFIWGVTVEVRMIIKSSGVYPESLPSQNALGKKSKWCSEKLPNRIWSMRSATGAEWQSNTIPSAEPSTKPCEIGATATAALYEPLPVPCSEIELSLIWIAGKLSTHLTWKHQGIQLQNLLLYRCSSSRNFIPLSLPDHENVTPHQLFFEI